MDSREDTRGLVEQQPRPPQHHLADPQREPLADAGYRGTPIGCIPFRPRAGRPVELRRRSRQSRRAANLIRRASSGPAEAPTSIHPPNRGGAEAGRAKLVSSERASARRETDWGGHRARGMSLHRLQERQVPVVPHREGADRPLKRVELVEVLALSAQGHVAGTSLDVGGHRLFRRSSPERPWAWTA